MSDINNLVPDLKEFIGAFEKKSHIGNITREAARLIIYRTRVAGRDVDDNLFDGLAESTKKIKRKNKRSTKSRLTDTKEMLNAIKGKVIGKGEGMVFFNSKEMEDRAAWNELGDSKRNRPSRVFFGLSPKDKRKLSNFIRDLYRKTTNTGV